MQKGTCGLYFLSTPVRKGKIQLVENTGVSKNIAGRGGGGQGKENQSCHQEEQYQNTLFTGTVL